MLLGKISELLVIGHKSMPFPVQNPGFDSGIERQGNSLTPFLSFFFFFFWVLWTDQLYSCLSLRKRGFMMAIQWLFLSI
jgi:hypothetical protein